MKTQTQSGKKEYSAPTILRVKLEEKQVFTAPPCKEGPDNPSCYENGITPIFDISAS